MNKNLSKATKDSSKKSETTTNGLGQSLFSDQKPARQSGYTENLSLTLSPLFEIYDTVKEDILHRGTEPEHPIGLRCLDELLWGIHKKELMTIGARTSMGKSAFAINMVKNLADEHKRIIYFSLEMSREQLVERLLCNFCKIDNIALRKGMRRDEFIKKERVFNNWIKELKLLIDDKYGYDFDKLLQVCEIIKPDFIIIDYIQMISTKGFRTKLDAIEEYVRKIKQVSSEMNFGTILLSQLNRTAVGEPDMSKLKWSGTLEEHSDCVLTLLWDWENNKYKIKIEKQRHGRIGNAEVEFLPQYSKFEEKVVSNPLPAWGESRHRLD